MRESRLWGLHLLAGAALVVLLSLHMGLMHYTTLLGLFGAVSEPVIGFASVAKRGRDAWWSVAYVLLLGFALYHGLYGLRGILREVWESGRAVRMIDAVVVAVGVVVFIYGTAVAIMATRLAGAN